MYGPPADVGVEEWGQITIEDDECILRVEQFTGFLSNLRNKVPQAEKIIVHLVD